MAAATTTTAAPDLPPQQPWFLCSTHPVLLPAHDALAHSPADFDAFLARQLVPEAKARVIDPDQAPATGPFVQGLVDYGRLGPNTTLTENGDAALRSTTNALVDLFAEFDDGLPGQRLQELLEAAWAEDPTTTLKIIFNARSIHLGKGSRVALYRAAGWLAQNHPLTLVANLRYLVRPLIAKKAASDTDGDAVVVAGPSGGTDDSGEPQVRHGLSHGYWKDLLNMLVLAVAGKLCVLADPRDLLNAKGDDVVSRVMIARRARRAGVAPPRSCRRRPRIARAASDDASAEGPGEEDAIQREAEKGSLDFKQKRRDLRLRRHAAAVDAFSNNAVYRALHLAVARLFAQQLRLDLDALGAEAQSGTRRPSVSLCAKWAPTQDHFHDRHTFVVSSIAELLHPRESLVPQDTDRETYLRHARERYRRDVSALRAHLAVVERDVTAGTLAQVRYERVPSLAMKALCRIFIAKDGERFEAYVSRVAEGKANMSGATLLPSTLVHGVRESQAGGAETASPKAMVRRRVAELEARVADGQWRTLVQRIRDSGTLASSMAVCDVSGSMAGPQFRDGSCPMDSAIGLSLLVAEVTTPPFGGAFITFSETPTVQPIDLAQSLGDKIRGMESAEWGFNTNLVKVFEDLILPMAVENKLQAEDMVKRIFVFSDMHFDGAQEHHVSAANSSDGNEDGDEDAERRDKQPADWSSSYERIKRRFADAGYQMPELVFWNLAGRAAPGQDAAPKPVAATEEGTCLVSGYSQGMLKVFLDNGSFEEAEVEESSVDDMVLVGQTTGSNSLRTLKRAIGHEAYAMLRVMD